MLAVCALAGGQTAAQPAQGESNGPLPEAPQPQPVQTTRRDSSDAVTVRSTPMHLLRDQGTIWSSPVHLNGGDLKVLVPLTLATGAAIATDYRAMTQVVPINPTLNQHSIDASNALIGGFIAAPVAFYGLGRFKQNAHQSEAGILNGEAMVDGVVVEEGMRLIFRRERPDVDGNKGHFFQSDAGTDGSFPSLHSVVAWSGAAVLAGEYPSWWSKLFFYSAATGVSITRVLGRQHFPSDVVVGSAVGWLVGRYVFRARHKYVPKLDDEY